MTVAIPEKLPSDQTELEEEREHDRRGCHYSLDGMTTLCGLPANNLNSVHPSYDSHLDQPDGYCSCNRIRCPRCREIWTS